MGKDMLIPDQCDRDAADAWKREWENCLGSHTQLVQAFARHRLDSTRELREALEELADAIDAENEATAKADRMAANVDAFEEAELAAAGNRAAEAIVRTWKATKQARAALAKSRAEGDVG